MIWNCDGKVKKIMFIYSSEFKEYYCYTAGRSYAWEKGWRNAGPWDWFKDGYTKKLDRWVKL